MDSMGPDSPGLHGTILGENGGESEDDEIPPPLTKTEQELLNNCLYPSANHEAVQIVCVEMPTACNGAGELNEDVGIVVKKEGF